jgi:hypothetical protein
LKKLPKYEVGIDTKEDRDELKKQEIKEQSLEKEANKATELTRYQRAPVTEHQDKEETAMTNANTTE